MYFLEDLVELERDLPNQEEPPQLTRTEDDGNTEDIPTDGEGRPGSNRLRV